MASSDAPASDSFVHLETIDQREPVPIVVKRFRKTLPLAAASQDSGLASAPASSAQESPASLRSWSVVAPTSNDAVRSLSFEHLQPASSPPLPGPLDVISQLPSGSRSSFERPVLRDASGALPQPVLSSPKEPSSTSSSSPLPRPCYASASNMTKALLIAWSLLCRWSLRLRGLPLSGVGLCLAFRPSRRLLTQFDPLRCRRASTLLRQLPRSLHFRLHPVPWKRIGCRPGCFL